MQTPAMSTNLTIRALAEQLISNGSSTPDILATTRLPRLLRTASRGIVLTSRKLPNPLRG